MGRARCFSPTVGKQQTCQTQSRRAKGISCPKSFRHRFLWTAIGHPPSGLSGFGPPQRQQRHFRGSNWQSSICCNPRHNRGVPRAGSECISGPPWMFHQSNLRVRGLRLRRSGGSESRWQLTGPISSPSALASIVKWVGRNLGLIERAPHCLLSLGNNRGPWKPIRPAALVVIVPNLATRAGKLVGNKFLGS